jgi:hypothetical protein
LIVDLEDPLVEDRLVYLIQEGPRLDESLGEFQEGDRVATEISLGIALENERLVF